MAANDDILHIRLNLNGVDIPLKIQRSDEVLYRDAAKIINARINAFVSKYGQRLSMDHIMLMVMLDLSMMYEREKGRSDSEPFLKSIQLLSASIDDVLKA